MSVKQKGSNAPISMAGLPTRDESFWQNERVAIATDSKKQDQTSPSLNTCTVSGRAETEALAAADWTSPRSSGNATAKITVLCMLEGVLRLDLAGGGGRNGDTSMDKSAPQ